MLKDLFISLGLSGFDIDTVVQIFIIVEENPLVHNSVVEAVIGEMDKEEQQQEKKYWAHESELADEGVVGNRTVEVSADKCDVELSLKTLRKRYV